MEDDDVFSDPLTSPNGSYDSPPSPNAAELRTISRGFGNMGMRSLSLPDVSHDKTTDQKGKHAQQSIINPVKEFIVNFVNRKAPKKRESEEKSKSKAGRGHAFIPFQLRNPTWCDLCGEFIWGLYKQCVRCKNCKYTCHWRCREEIDLDCIGAWPSNIERNMSIDEIAMKTLHLLEQDDPKKNEPYLMVSTNISSGSLRRKIEAFNTQTTGLIMTMKDDCTFQGFVRVHMNLLRPINIVAGQRPLSIFEIVAGSVDSKKSQRTSFFLPLGTVKALHVTSETTVQEVIEALLKKFKIADNPRKFALFECYQEQDDHVILRRMTDKEKPLLLRLLWGGADIRHSFSLQENETGDIVWEVFSIPELINFIKILDKEEEEHIAMVKEKYKRYKEKLEFEMGERRKQEGNSSPSKRKSN